MKDRPVLNIIGTGKLGTILGRLLAEADLVSVGSLFSRHLPGARDAATFIGSGNPVTDLADTRPADLWLLSVADDAIGAVADRLSRLDLPWEGAVAFHCSGIHTSEILAPLGACGADTASIHPIHSFADRERSVTHFAGTFCTFEGSGIARDRLEHLFSPLGAHVVEIDAGRKDLYHAATAMASNQVVALLDAGLQLLEAAGVERDTGRAMLQPLARQSLDNLFSLGAARALTGPVARGDTGTVERHLDAIGRDTPALLDTYLSLSRLALQIARTGQDNPGHRKLAGLLFRAEKSTEARKPPAGD